MEMAIHAEGSLDYAMEQRQGTATEKRTYSDGSWHQVTFVQHEDQVLVWCLFAHVFLHAATTGALGIPCVKNMQDDI